MLLYSTCIYGNILHASVDTTLSLCQMSIVIYSSTINIIQSFQILQHGKKYNEIYFCVISTSFIWVWNLVADIEGGKEAEGIWEYGVEENIWT